MNKVSAPANQYDVIVLGGGAAGMTAALVAAIEGLSVCLLEKEKQIGGTTAWSGGQVWAPCSPILKKVGDVPDNLDAVRSYLREVVRGSENDVRMTAFLGAISEAVNFLIRHSQVQLQPVPDYPDYYPDFFGASVAGRVLEPKPFDASVLRSNLHRLRLPLPEFSLFKDMMIARQNLPHYRRVLRSPVSFGIVIKSILRHGWEKIRFGRGVSLVLGNALVGRFYASLLDSKVTIRTERVVRSLIRSEDGKVAAVELEDGRVFRARWGIVLATGGFSHDPRRRREQLPSTMSESSATFSGATGDGARLSNMVGGCFRSAAGENAFLAPISSYKRTDGSVAVFPHTVSDRAKPGLIAVDQTGQRFVNEAVSYHEFGKALLSHHNKGAAGGTAFAWLIADKAFSWKYGLGALKPMHLNLRFLLSQEYIVRSPSITELAVRLNLPVEALVQTVADYNSYATKGEDPKFSRGCNAYQRFLGDAEVKPNPCVAPMASPPFFAVKIEIGDLGTAAGIATDGSARVLDEEGSPIDGLYACGLDAHSVMEGNYPGPGITLGPAIAFGYLAAKDISSRARQP